MLVIFIDTVHMHLLLSVCGTGGIVVHIEPQSIDLLIIGDRYVKLLHEHFHHLIYTLVYHQVALFVDRCLLQVDHDNLPSIVFNINWHVLSRSNFHRRAQTKHQV